MLKNRLKILHVSHISNYTPPIGYGGIEYIVDILARHQLRQGHIVKVVGVKPTHTTSYLISSVFKTPIKRPRAYHKLYHTLYVLKESLDVDVIHIHVQWIAPIMAIVKSVKPSLLTLHADLSKSLFNSLVNMLGLPLIAISRTQKERLERQGFKVMDVIYHGIEVEKYPLITEKEDYLIYVGRIDKSKGVHLAVRAATRSGERLVLIGPVTDYEYFRYFIQPFVDGKKIIYLGEVDFKTKVQYLARAKALLYPVQYEEFFGLIMIEALASGTPVIGFARGSVKEIVIDGVTGYLAHSEDDIAKAIRNIDKISPIECRRDVEKRFSATAMTERYIDVYMEVMGR